MPEKVAFLSKRKPVSKLKSVPSQRHILTEGP